MNPPLPPTEAVDPQGSGLDVLETTELVAAIVGDQRAAVEAVLAQSGKIAQVVDAVSERLARGGRLHYAGAGTSGRLAMLDAAEIPPTFGTPRELVCAHIAGGAGALTDAIEGAEDDAGAGDAAMRDHVAPDDAVVGISASGGAAFVIAALERARATGAYTFALTSSADSPLVRAAETTIVLATGAEILAGSTRLKAGTAQKIALNAISTAVMVRLGKIHGNLMVDVVATNRKLEARALRLIATLTGAGERRARELLEAAGGRVKVAAVMHLRNLPADEARLLLERHDGKLRGALE